MRTNVLICRDPCNSTLSPCLNEAWIMHVKIMKNNKNVMYIDIRNPNPAIIIHNNLLFLHLGSLGSFSSKSVSTGYPAREKFKPELPGLLDVLYLRDLKDDRLGSLAAGADVDVHVPDVLLLHLDIHPPSIALVNIR